MVGISKRWWKIKRALKIQFIFRCFEQNKLIGFIRCLGDGEHIVIVQDLIVDPSYYRQGIGTNLFKAVSEKYKDVRSFCLFTDIHDIRDNEFYKSLGMVKIEEREIVSYIR